MEENSALHSAPMSRRFRILGILGKGGFGTVYHGRLEDPDGFVKEVAIKLLHEQDPAPETLSRFRDEARILGRLRDRGIVTVDPPTRLGGKWAVIMEYVDGTDCRRLLKEHSRLPSKVALEIVQEIARTLDNLWNHPDEHGSPMRLLHRDLKPSNIQLTPSGTVKLLDFGVAKADFGPRETETQSQIAGTFGYIAPERTEGVEDASGDIYSLGVVLEELVSGRRPRKTGEESFARSRPMPAPLEVLALAAEMHSMDPARRPSANEVEHRCGALVRDMPGPSLREWSRDCVGRGPPMGPDALVGQTIAETLSRASGRTSYTTRQPRRRSSVPAMLVAASSLLLVGLVALLVSVGVFTAVLFARPELVALVWGGAVSEPSPAALPLEPIVAPLEPVPPVPAATPEPLPAPAVGPVDPVEASPAVTPAPAPRPDPRPRPQPAVAQPAPAPEPIVIIPTPAPPATGTVSVTGAERVELVGDAGTFAGGQVPAGTYAIRAKFPETELIPAGKVTVTAGERLSLYCDARFKRCQAQ